MKPTLSYIRGLRDVLEIPTKEERRAHVKNIEIMSTTKGCCCAIFGVSGLIFPNFVIDNSISIYTRLSLGLLGLGAVVGYVINGYHLLQGKDKLEKAGRAYQEFKRHGTPIPSELEREAFE